MIDPETRVDFNTIKPNRVWYTHYTLVNKKASDLDLVKFREEAQAGTLKFYKTDASSQGYRDYGVTLDYDFYDKDGNHLVEVKVGPSDLNAQ
jgi:hypothetical protein